MESESIGCLRDLEKYGIVALTGEAEGISGLGRILFDLTEQGVDIVNKFLGGNITFMEHSNWNSQTNGKKHIACVMLGRRIIEDLNVFCLMTKYKYVVKFGAYFYGSNEEDFIQKFPKEEHCETYRKMGTAGSRNTHVMSGRTT